MRLYCFVKYNILKIWPWRPMSDHLMKISLGIKPDGNGWKRKCPLNGSYVECLILSCCTIERSVMDTTASSMD